MRNGGEGADEQALIEAVAAEMAHGFLRFPTISAKRDRLKIESCEAAIRFRLEVFCVVPSTSHLNRIDIKIATHECTVIDQYMTTILFSRLFAVGVEVSN